MCVCVVCVCMLYMCMCVYMCVCVCTCVCTCVCMVCVCVGSIIVVNVVECSAGLALTTGSTLHTASTNTALLLSVVVYTFISKGQNCSGLTTVDSAGIPCGWKQILRESHVDVKQMQ